MQPFTDMKVWQRCHALVLRVYAVTKEFPEDERYGITSQLRRAAVSVPTNIVEGSRKPGPKDFARFLHVSAGSLAETRYLLMLSRDLGFLQNPAADELLQEVEEISRMLHVFCSRIEETPARGSSPSTVREPEPEEYA